MKEEKNIFGMTRACAAEFHIRCYSVILLIFLTSLLVTPVEAQSGRASEGTAGKSEKRQAEVLFALELYRGDLLEGFFVSSAPGFERWLEEERERLRRVAAGAAWQLAEYRGAI